jgi:hypothetical protein
MEDFMDQTNFDMNAYPTTTIVNVVSQIELTLPDGSKYVGGVKNGKPQGKGDIKYPTTDERQRYQGEFQNGLPDGEGVMAWKNGDKYEGAFVEDKLNGFGTFNRANGTVDKGLYKDNQLNGQGTRTKPDCTFYSGGWKDGKQHGKGKLQFPSRSNYDGEFRDGEFWEGNFTDHRPGNNVFVHPYHNGREDSGCKQLMDACCTIL